MICLKWYCECELANCLLSVTLFFSKCICLLMLLIIYNMPGESSICLVWFIHQNWRTWKFWAHVLKELMVECLELAGHIACVCVCVCVCVCMCVLSSDRLFATPWAVAHQAPLSMGFPRQEHWSGVPFPSPGDLPHSGIEPPLLHLLNRQAGSLPAEPLVSQNAGFSCGF